ncbi:TetR/AcrR family transcriptional regulator [Halioxenophilus sp. WMMB6]|uniref:TetR/AcrR family transcriptional regulator n=1 Tax=Halioxenophilus sp. WMMB6 TaxID=3073815 RepID=UPI00295EAF6E|nr:TetR/AcrR family transcriptional regulator [Halioxenophilus sp. WMMB6]
MSKPVKKKLTQSERVALSDEKMFEAAIALIIEQGVNNTTLKEVGERAGFSRGMAHYRFGSKENLLVELISTSNHHWRNNLTQYVTQKDGLNAVMGALEAFEMQLLNLADETRALYILWFESVGHDSSVRDRLSQIHAHYRDDISQWIAEGIEEQTIRADVNPVFMAQQICSFFFGFIYQWVVNEESVDIRNSISDYRKNLVRLLAPA